MKNMNFQFLSAFPKNENSLSWKRIHLSQISPMILIQMDSNTQYFTHNFRVEKGNQSV